MTSVWLSRTAVAEVTDLLAVAAAVSDTSDADHYELVYCRSQVGKQMPAIEILVVAGSCVK
jgi:hypothetical protein